MNVFLSPDHAEGPRQQSRRWLGAEILQGTLRTPWERGGDTGRGKGTLQTEAAKSKEDSRDRDTITTEGERMILGGEEMALRKQSGSRLWPG